MDGLNGDSLRSATEVIVMKLLADRPMYGYEIIREVEVRTGGAFRWKEGTLYPCLHKLELRRCVESEWDTTQAKPRKYYRLTTAGARELARKLEESAVVLGALQTLLFA